MTTSLDQVLIWQGKLAIGIICVETFYTGVTLFRCYLFVRYDNILWQCFTRVYHAEFAWTSICN
jgi:hypothetical protein